MNKQLTRKQLGALGEELAWTYLEEQHYELIEKNWRCRTGEIDLIVMEDSCLVFVEVRTRSGSPLFGTPQESVNAKKQQQVMETAQFYVHRYQKQHLQLRFDVISIITTKTGTQVSLNHLVNAF
ncbi:putative endonuclease [Paenibacillus sp. 1_12]|uniref:YraN family protein n=1 Tax=Paenibacillus sp. 1_12 TaxID=1566278 RepID=UPI0008EC5CBD|nr:YraN family protein [Paenibacillus sp. 1_12]SFL46728.1 putative endonuclease [Paenibacillus sp. 1_12]